MAKKTTKRKTKKAGKKKAAARVWVYIGPEKSGAFALKVTVAEISPAIWRRLVVRADATLEELHYAIQIAFGWANYHIHEFRVGERQYRIPFGGGFDPDFEEGVQDAGGARLETLSLAPKSKLLYAYDFGDGWEHEIAVEKRLEIAEAEAAIAAATGWRFTKATRTPVAACIAGERAGPIEDSGGPWGYADLCEIMADPSHPEHEERKEWVEGFAANGVGKEGFDPERFDLKKVNEGLRKWVKR